MIDKNSEPDEPSEAPGWDALDARLDAVVSAEPDHHFASVPPPMLGGPPIQGISVYSREDPDHWFFVTYGFSDLFEDEWPDTSESGFGFELTLALARKTESEPPAWALNVLQNIARYVFSTGNVLESGHHMNLNGPIQQGSETLIQAIGVVRDPELGEIETPHGTVEFRRLAGLTIDELQAVQRWSPESFFALYREQVPGLVLDLERPSLLENPELAQKIDEGIRTEGSTTGGLFVSRLTVDKGRKEVRLGAIGARAIKSLLRPRLGFARSLFLDSPEDRLLLKSGPTTTLTLESDHASLQLAAADLDQLEDELRPVAGPVRLESLAPWRLIIEKSEVRNSDGTLVDVIG